MRRLLSLLVSMRTTAVVLVALCVLLLLNVAVPQAALDPEGFGALVRRGGVARWLVADLGLGRISTSPVFLGTLTLFFANLSAVLVDRIGATIRRVRLLPPTTAQARALLRDGIALPDPGTLHADAVAATLGALGYRTGALPDGLWAVRHRLALLGFPLFHASFLVLFAGGMQLYLTRDVVNTGGGEGEEVVSTKGALVRAAPLGRPPPLRLAIERVDPRLVAGSPVDLAVSLRAVDVPGPAQVSRVNAPATWGALTVLVDRVGILPVLWVQDAQGYTLDRVAVVTSGGKLPTHVPLADARIEAVVHAIPIGEGFPERSALGTVPVHVRLLVGGQQVFDGNLRRGESAQAGELRVVLEEVRYWAGLTAVSERGGGLLIAGFLLLVLGIVWRMFWYRRDVVVCWGVDAVRVGGRADFNPGQFRAELRGMCDALESTRTRGEERRP